MLTRVKALIKSRLHSRSYWTIGFIEQSAEELFETQNTNPQIHWIKDMPTDRFWADPFLLDVEENGDMRVLVEEVFWTEEERGSIVELRVSKDYRLVERIPILEEGFHLSYPFIERREGKVFVYPESSGSGAFFRYILHSSRLMKEGMEIEEPLCDATKVRIGETEWWFASKRIVANKELCAYYRPAGTDFVWTPHPKNPIVQSTKYARMAGAFVFSEGEIYRCAQNCAVTYGSALEIMQVDVCNENEYKEHLHMTIKPDKNAPYGIHTINTYKGITVVDGIQKMEANLLTRIIFMIQKMRSILHLALKDRR